MQSGSGWRGRAASSVCPPGEARGGGADDTRLQSRTCLHTMVPSLFSVSHLHPHTHTILALLIQGKERLMLSAWTGHHKLFFLNRRKKHVLPTVTSSHPSSLLSSSLMRSHGLGNTEGTKDHYNVPTALGTLRHTNSHQVPVHRSHSPGG